MIEQIAGNVYKIEFNNIPLSASFYQGVVIHEIRGTTTQLILSEDDDGDFQMLLYDYKNPNKLQTFDIHIEAGKMYNIGLLAIKLAENITEFGENILDNEFINRYSKIKR